MLIRESIQLKGKWYWGNFPIKHRKVIQYNPSGMAGNVLLNLCNSVHLHSPCFTNHVYFTPHDRPPLLNGHHLGRPLYRGSIVLGVEKLWRLWLKSTVNKSWKSSINETRTVTEFRDMLYFAKLQNMLTRCQKQVSSTCISNHIAKNIVICN